MKKQIVLFLMALLAPINMLAVEVEINGIWYNLVSRVKEAKVIKNKSNTKYSGVIEVPATVNYEGGTYSVTSIEKKCLQ